MRVTFRSLDLETLSMLSAALTCALLIWSRRWLNRATLRFQKSSSSLGPELSTSRRICSDSATTCKLMSPATFYLPAQSTKNLS